VSSTEYFAEFRPDPCLCRVVSWSGAALAAVGLVACTFLALPPAVRIAASLSWCGLAAIELLRLHRSTRSCTAFRILGDGTAAVRARDGDWRPATLMAGSILLRRYGWLRLRTPGGRVIMQPVRGSVRDSRDWRRLQVIWRHVGAVR
jgi:hypothetical protein